MNKAAAVLMALALAAPASTSLGTSQEKEKLFVEDKEGFIVIEAEHFHNKVDKDPHKWVATKEPAGFSGDGAMEAKPNEDANNDAEDYPDISPRLDYKVKFAKAGKYRVWVRGYGKTDSDNSCHIALDGQAVAATARIGDFPTEEWAWQNETKDNVAATIEIKEPGVHTINLLMREDGFVADKILLTRDEK